MDWNTRVAAWEDVAASPAFQRLADLIIENAQPSADDRVVDLGAGTGLLTFRLASAVHDVIAIDAAPAMVEHVRARSQRTGVHNVQAVVSDLRALELPDASRTLAVSNYAYHHLDREGKRTALGDLYRILEPGGRVAICDMMFALSLHPRDRRIIADKVRLMARRGPAGIVRILRNAGRVATGRWEHPERPEVWVALLAEAGLTDIQAFELSNEAGLVVARRPA
jgi:ubiquinone/menaquinone biosynthesis C-methylase UbiE